jgi:hypothetical protein
LLDPLLTHPCRSLKRQDNNDETNLLHQFEEVSVMFVSGTFLFVILSIAILFFAKQLARRDFYREVQKPQRSFGWHNDPTRPDPRLGIEGDLQLWNATGEAEKRADTQRIS